MKVIHIDANNKGDAAMLKNEYKNGNHIFMLIRRDGCPPCESTKPEWLKIGNSSQIMPKSGIIADIEEQALNEIGYMNPAVNVAGFPTMVCIKNKKIKSYEDSMSGKRDETSGKSRTVDSFVDWIVEEYGTKPRPNKTRKMKGGKRRRGGAKSKSKRTRRRVKKSAR
jgi:hypothetical protein